MKNLTDCITSMLVLTLTLAGIILTLVNPTSYSIGVMMIGLILIYFRFFHNLK